MCVTLRTNNTFLMAACSDKKLLCNNCHQCNSSSNSNVLLYLVVFVEALLQPKDDIVKFWQSVVGPNYDIVVSPTESSFCKNYMH